MAGAFIKPLVDVVSKQEKVNFTKSRRGRKMKTLTERARSERKYIFCKRAVKLNLSCIRF